MGRGDRKTKRGKIWIGSYGNCRPKEKNMPESKPEPKPEPKPEQEEIIQEAAPVE